MHVWKEQSETPASSNKIKYDTSHKKQQELGVAAGWAW
jgi:hypothetical protein